jgi:hypothetical protein
VTASPTRSLLPGLLAAAVLGLLAGLWLLYPAWLAPDNAVVGDWRHPDMISNHWLYRWVAEQVLSGGSLLHNDRYYFPVGDAPWLAGNGSDAVPYALFSAAVAPILAWPGSVTFWLMLACALNAVGGWALARAAGARDGGALLVAAALAMSPYVAHELMGGRFSQVPLYWFCLFLAAWLRALDRADPTLGWEEAAKRAAPFGVAAGLLYGATAFTYWYMGLWAACFGTVLLLVQWRRWPMLLAFLPVGLLSTLPPLAVFLRGWAQIPGATETAFPHPLSEVSSLAPTFLLWGGAGERGEVILPLLLLLPAAFELRARGTTWQLRLAALSPTERALGLLALLFALLCLGPELHLPDGTPTGIPGPYLLVYGATRALRRFWWPYRHVVGLSLALLPLAALGLDRWFGQIRAARGRLPAAMLGVALVLLLPIDLLVRGGRFEVPISWFDAPDVYQRIARLEGDTMLELPLSPQLATSQQTLSYQWVHHKALVNGHAMWVDRVRPPAWDRYVQQNSFLSRIQEFEQGKLFGAFAFKPEDVDALRKSGVRLLVVNAEYLPQALFPLLQGYRQLFTQAFGEPTLTFRDQLYAWDLESYNFRGALDAPEFRLPADYLTADGSRMLDVGYNRPQGWRTVARLFPPVIPPRGEDLGGANAPGDPGQFPGGQGGIGHVPTMGADPGSAQPPGPQGALEGGPVAPPPSGMVPSPEPAIGPLPASSPGAPAAPPPTAVPPGAPAR